MSDAYVQELYGFVGPQKTSKDHWICHFYDPNPKLNYAVAQVYEEEFDFLPQHVRALIENRIARIENDELLMGSSTPLKSVAESARENHPDKMVFFDPWFKVTVIKKRVQWDQSPAQASSSGQQPVSQVQSPRPVTISPPSSTEYTWKELDDEQRARFVKLANEAAWQNVEILKAVTALTEDMDWDVVLNVFKSSAYDVAKLWPIVRGAVVEPVAQEIPDNPDFTALAVELIIEGDDPDGFLQAVANGSPGIIDVEHAKAVLKALGETGIKPGIDERRNQARKAWMYVDLTSRHGLGQDAAKRIVSSTLDYIPF